MKITYDPEADGLYISLREVDFGESVDIEEGVTADLDADGHIVGFEVPDVRHRLSVEELNTVSFENLVAPLDDKVTA